MIYLDKPLKAVTVEEYEELKSDQRLLAALYASGVDNWEGFDDAVNSLEEHE